MRTALVILLLSAPFVIPAIVMARGDRRRARPDRDHGRRDRPADPAPPPRPRGAPLVPRTPGSPVPPGHVRVRDQDGRLWSIDLQAAMNDADPTELTPDQIRRVRAFKGTLAEHERTSLDQALANFRRDRAPEREILLWERIARAYREELAVRPDAGPRERGMLYRALFACSFEATEANVLDMIPDAKSLPDLDRAIDRYRSA